MNCFKFYSNGHFCNTRLVYVFKIKTTKQGKLMDKNKKPDQRFEIYIIKLTEKSNQMKSLFASALIMFLSASAISITVP